MDKKYFKYILIIIVSFLAYNYIQISLPKTKKVSIDSKKIDKNIKITQVSDFHNNKYINIEKIILKIKKFNPDIIVLTGDIIDRNTVDFTESIDLVKGLNSICDSIYFISGNHEMDNPKANLFLSEIENIGVAILNNSSKELKVRENHLNLIGLEYRSEDKLNTDSFQASNFNLILAHSPDRVVKKLTGREDLVLCGHTHGGQVRLPLIGAILAPEQGYFPELDKGMYEINDTKLYIDSGLGNSIMPIRFLNRVQVSNIEIGNYGT